MIEARVIADSLAPCRKRALTFVCTYPRFIHSEVMTHRAFSRNAASSRAIPVERMIARVLAEPAMPIHWGANQKGMQAGGEIPELWRPVVKCEWECAMLDAVKHAKALLLAGVHKQIANRLLEPFAHMTTIITATEWENFFCLRAHKDAQPEFQELAFSMLRAYLASTPAELAAGQWHLPFADKYLDDGLDLAQLLKITTARCARVSYLNFEGEIAFEKDYELHDDLLESGHVSPFEHALRAESTPARSGNVVGFTQYRKMLPGECRTATRAELEQMLAQREAA